MKEILFRAKAINREPDRGYRTDYKNGTMIFEGDIVKKRTWHGTKYLPVTFSFGCFHCGFGGGSSTATHPYTLNDKQIEVVGNIYNNPELIKE